VRFGPVSPVYEARKCTTGVDQYSGLFHYYSLGGDTARPGGIHARLCHAFLFSNCGSSVVPRRSTAGF